MRFSLRFKRTISLYRKLIVYIYNNVYEQSSENVTLRLHFNDCIQNHFRVRLSDKEFRKIS